MGFKIKDSDFLKTLLGSDIRESMKSAELKGEAVSGDDEFLFGRNEDGDRVELSSEFWELSSASNSIYDTTYRFGLTEQDNLEFEIPRSKTQDDDIDVKLVKLWGRPEWPVTAPEKVFIDIDVETPLNADRFTQGTGGIFTVDELYFEFGVESPWLYPDDGAFKTPTNEIIYKKDLRKMIDKVYLVTEDDPYAIPETNTFGSANLSSEDWVIYKTGDVDFGDFSATLYNHSKIEVNISGQQAGANPTFYYADLVCSDYDGEEVKLFRFELATALTFNIEGRVEFDPYEFALTLKEPEGE